MMEQCIIGGLIALVLGFMLLHRLVGKREQNIATKAPSDVQKSSENGACRTDGPPDVVVVGAGVAGSALAYSLAKVGLLFMRETLVFMMMKSCFSCLMFEFCRMGVSCK